MSLLLILLLSLFAVSVSGAQESAGAQPASMQVVSLGQASPVVQRVTPAKNQKLEEEYPRLFWIFPTCIVADSKSHSPLTGLDSPLR